jgi:hypothetical protein
VRCEEVGMPVPAFRVSGVRRTAPLGSDHRAALSTNATGHQSRLARHDEERAGCHRAHEEPARRSRLYPCVGASSRFHVSYPLHSRTQIPPYKLKSAGNPRERGLLAARTAGQAVSVGRSTR